MRRRLGLAPKARRALPDVIGGHRLGSPDLLRLRSPINGNRRRLGLSAQARRALPDGLGGRRLAAQRAPSQIGRRLGSGALRAALPDGIGGGRRFSAALLRGGLASTCSAGVSPMASAVVDSAMLPCCAADALPDWPLTSGSG